jgi:hypothetical protein
MKPDISKITIKDNETQIKEMLLDLVLRPRLKALEWAEITKQTPNMKIGYPGQHLASLVTGMPGTRTGARGHDLVDGSETKSCSRVDQVDKCMNGKCGAKVMRSESVCPECCSVFIKRNDDSKWLFTIRSENDLKTLTNVPRVILALADYPHFEFGDFDTLRFRIFEIWPKADRHKFFVDLMTNYFKDIYTSHKTNDAAKTPAPKNFWPDSYQFYKCNPVLTFSATVKNSLTQPSITIDTFVNPGADRADMAPLPMPSSVLTAEEIRFVASSNSDTELRKCLVKGVKLAEFKALAKSKVLKKEQHKELCEMLPALGEILRKSLPLRDTDKPKSFIQKYVRK